MQYVLQFQNKTLDFMSQLFSSYVMHRGHKKSIINYY